MTVYFLFLIRVHIQLSYLLSSFRVDWASPKLIMSLGFHTGDPTIKKKNKRPDLINVCLFSSNYIFYNKNYKTNKM